MDKIRIAIATKGYKGLEDTVSNVFGKAKTFTVVNVENGQISNVRVVDNPAAACNQGSGRGRGQSGEGCSGSPRKRKGKNK